MKNMYRKKTVLSRRARIILLDISKKKEKFNIIDSVKANYIESKENND